MSKYIDADKVIDYANQEVSSPFFSIEREGAEDVITYKNKWAFVKQVMIGIPAADVVEVCRCEHCSKSAEHPNGRWCRIHQSVVQNSDYCSWGTKR